MSRKIFISYKYADGDVRHLPSAGPLVPTTARHYVDALTKLLDIHDHIYKGENDNESLAGFKDETIASKLREKIFDSSITLVLISKNMKDPSVSEEEQWIPWEISYSLKEMTKGDRTSGANAMLAIVLPDKNGSYAYFMEPICQNGCRNWKTDFPFEIIGKNMFNRKEARTATCAHHPHSTLHVGNDHSYIHPVLWDHFISDVNGHINHATKINENIDEYNIIKTLRVPSPGIFRTPLPKA